MSQQALDNITKKIKDRIVESKAFRNELDKHTHIYRVDLNTIQTQIVAQITHLFSERKVPNRVKLKILKLSEEYVKNLRDTFKRYARSATSIDTVFSNESVAGFTVHLTAKKDQAPDIFRALNDQRVTKANSPLKILREQLFEYLSSGAVREEEASGNFTQDLDKAVYGAKHKVTETRSGGLLQTGHGAGHAVADRRYALAIEDLRSKWFKDEIQEETKGFLHTSKSRKALLEVFVKSVKSLGIPKLGKTEITVVHVEDESSRVNLGKASKEKAALNNLSKEISDYILSSDFDFVNQKGSNSIMDNVLGLIVAPAVKRKAKGTAKITKPKKSTTISKTEVKGTRTTSSSKGGVPKGRRSKFMQTVPTKKGGTRNLSLLSILRLEIKKVVAANMTLPRLVYRTGRFANSVNVVDVIETAKGFPSVGYTYMHNPYDVFRMDIGNHLATPDRDPRSIIDISIRQIAARFGLTRVFTRGM